MSPIQDTRFDYFLHASTAWLNFTYFDNDWQSGEKQEESSKEKKTRLILGYIAGMVERVLCAISKIVLLAGFIIISLGLSLQAFYYYVSAKRVDNEQNPIPKTLFLQAKYRFYESTLITGSAVCVTAIDTIGILCPPLAYRLHTMMQEKIVLPVLNYWGIILRSDRGNFGFSNYLQLLIDPKSKIKQAS